MLLAGFNGGPFPANDEADALSALHDRVFKLGEKTDADTIVRALQLYQQTGTVVVRSGISDHVAITLSTPLHHVRFAWGRTLLHALAEGVTSNNEEVVVDQMPMIVNVADWLVLEAGVPVDAPDMLGRTALHFAAAKGKDLLVTRLIELGANPHAQDVSGRAPHPYAKQGGGRDLPEKLRTDEQLAELRGSSSRSAKYEIRAALAARRKFNTLLNVNPADAVNRELALPVSAAAGWLPKLSPLLPLLPSDAELTGPISTPTSPAAGAHERQHSATPSWTTAAAAPHAATPGLPPRTRLAHQGTPAPTGTVGRKLAQPVTPGGLQQQQAALDSPFLPTRRQLDRSFASQSSASSASSVSSFSDEAMSQAEARSGAVAWHAVRHFAALAADPRIPKPHHRDAASPAAIQLLGLSIPEHLDRGKLRQHVVANAMPCGVPQPRIAGLPAPPPARALFAIGTLPRDVCTTFKRMWSTLYFQHAGRCTCPACYVDGMWIADTVRLPEDSAPGWVRVLRAKARSSDVLASVLVCPAQQGEVCRWGAFVCAEVLVEALAGLAVHELHPAELSQLAATAGVSAKALARAQRVVGDALSAGHSALFVIEGGEGELRQQQRLLESWAHKWPDAGRNAESWAVPIVAMSKEEKEQAPIAAAAAFAGMSDWMLGTATLDAEEDFGYASPAQAAASGGKEHADTPSIAHKARARTAE